MIVMKDAERAKQAQWICYDCGVEYIGSMPEDRMATFHYDICGVCGERKICTEPRDFGEGVRFG